MLPRTLVNDLLSSDAGKIGSGNGVMTTGPKGVTIGAKFVTKAVENSTRNINKHAMLANMEQIFEKEIEAGHFIKVRTNP